MTTLHWEPWKLSHAYPRIGSGTTPTSTDARYYTDSCGTPWVTTAELRENYLSATKQNVTQEALNALLGLADLQIWFRDDGHVRRYDRSVGHDRSDRNLQSGLLRL